jgi:hypothetical protein
MDSCIKWGATGTAQGPVRLLSMKSNANETERTNELCKNKRAKPTNKSFCETYTEQSPLGRGFSGPWPWAAHEAEAGSSNASFATLLGVILFTVIEFLTTGSQVSLLFIIDVI